MGIEENKTAVQSMYEAFGRGDIDGLLALLSDDVLWSAHTASDSPLTGEYKGKAGVGEFFTKVGQLEIEKFDIGNIVAEGDLVVVLLAERYTIKATGKVHDGTLVHIFHLGSDGKVDRFDEYESTNDAWRS